MRCSTRSSPRSPFRFRASDARRTARKRRARKPAPSRRFALQSITRHQALRETSWSTITISPSSSAAAPPGINSVIGAATIRARLEGIDVLGIRDGFEWIMQGDIDHVMPLTIDAVSRIHFRGGSHIGISRANPTTNPSTARERHHVAPAPERLAAHHDRRRRHGVLGDAARAARGRPDPRRPRAEDHRQRSRPAAARRHVRLSRRRATTASRSSRT